MGVLIDIYHAYKLKEVNKLWKYRLSKFINKISLWLATDVNWSLLHTEKWKVAESMRHLFEWHFIPHTLSPETREGGILAVHASRSTVSMHTHLLQAPLQPDCSSCYQSVDDQGLLSQKMRGHIYPFRSDGSNRPDRSHIKHQTLHHHHCLLHACRGLFRCWIQHMNNARIILRTTGECKKCPCGTY
jgi:hypothetical protein